MNDDLTKLTSLANLGATFKDNPLKTYSDETLSKELKSRGWDCGKPLKLEGLDFELKLLDFEEIAETTPKLFQRHKKSVKR